MVFADNQLPPIYQTPNVRFDKDVYTWGDTVTVRIISPINNADSTVPDIIQTSADATPDPTGDYSRIDHTKVISMKDYSLVETGPDTGIFLGSFELVKPGDNKTGEPRPNNGVLAVDPSFDYIAVFVASPAKTIEALTNFTYESDPSPPHDVFYDALPQYPAAQFRWIGSNPQDGGIGKIHVDYPEQNMSADLAESFTVKLRTPDYSDMEKYVSLTETGKNTGIFEGMIHVVSYPSPTKLTMTGNESLPVSVYYPSDTGFDYLGNSHFQLFASTGQPLVAQKPNHDIVLHTDRKAYLPGQTISIHGVAEPGEHLDVEILRKAAKNVITGVMQYLHLESDHTGAFNGTIKLSDSKIDAAEYVVRIAGSRHDELATKYIKLTSFDDLRIHKVDVPPLQQMAMGISPDDIVCQQAWRLAIKPNGDHVCMQPPTLDKLEPRGWKIAN